MRFSPEKKTQQSKPWITTKPQPTFLLSTLSPGPQNRISSRHTCHSPTRKYGCSSLPFQPNAEASTSHQLGSWLARLPIWLFSQIHISSCQPNQTVLSFSHCHSSISYSICIEQSVIKVIQEKVSIIGIIECAVRTHGISSDRIINIMSRTSCPHLIFIIKPHVTNRII